MADTKISALPAASTPLTGSEVVPLNQSGVTSNVTVANLTAGRAISALSVTSPTIGATTSTNLNLQSNATTNAVLDTNGNLGVGVTPSAWRSGTKALQIGSYTNLMSDNSNAALQLTSNAYNNGTNWIYENNGYANLYQNYQGQHQWYYAPSGTAGNAITFTQAMTLDVSGNLVVGTPSAIGSGKVSISFPGATANAIETQDSGTNSGAAFFSCRNSGGTQIGSITRVGTTNAVVFNTTSDQRLKSNIENSTPILDTLMQVQVRQFDWTEGETHQDYGFIAQEVEPLLSGVVTKGKTEEDIWQLDYSRLTPHLLKAIQELKAEFDSLKAQINGASA